MKRLFASDIVIFGYIFVVSIAAILFLNNWYLYIGYHTAVIFLLLLIHYAYCRFSSWFWRLLKYWIIIIVVLSAYREVFYLVPAINHGNLYDEQLLNLDINVLSYNILLCKEINIYALSDILTFCYWMYFPIPLLLGVWLYARGQLADYRKAMCGLIAAWLISYLGYLLVPAMGPYWYEPRPEILNGWGFAKLMHEDVMLNIQWGSPDAFPSGHTLIAIVSLYYAFRFTRRLFWFLLPIGVGLIIGTVYLRYHYIIDLLASFVLAPLIIWGASHFFCRWDRGDQA